MDFCKQAHISIIDAIRTIQLRSEHFYTDCLDRRINPNTALFHQASYISEWRSIPVIHMLQYALNIDLVARTYMWPHHSAKVTGRGSNVLTYDCDGLWAVKFDCNECMLCAIPQLIANSLHCNLLLCALL